jgi:hypothetical protein
MSDQFHDDQVFGRRDMRAVVAHRCAPQDLTLKLGLGRLHFQDQRAVLGDEAEEIRTRRESGAVLTRRPLAALREQIAEPLHLLGSGLNRDVDICRESRFQPGVDGMAADQDVRHVRLVEQAEQ